MSFPHLWLATSNVSGPVGVRDLKNHLSAYLDLVKSGHEIVVTEHGRPIARLSPVSADVDRMAALVEAGIVQPALSAKPATLKRAQLWPPRSAAGVLTMPTCTQLKTSSRRSGNR